MLDWKTHFDPPAQMNIKMQRSGFGLLDIHERLGFGVFSDVFRATDLDQQEYALKVIPLNHPNLNEQDRLNLMALVKHEVAILKKLNLLSGFIKNDEEACILMPLFQGKTTMDTLTAHSPHLQLDPELTQETIKKSFKALVQLHLRGVVHLDCHLDNFMQQDSASEPQPIDFGMAQFKNKYNTLEDCMVFYFYDKHMAKLVTKHKACSIQQLVSWYLEACMAYVRQHKSKLAFKFFLYGTISLALVQGLQLRQALRIMLWELCKTVTLDTLSDSMITKLDHSKVAVLMSTLSLEPSKNRDKITLEHNNIKVRHAILSALVFWGLMRSAHSPFNLFSKIAFLCRNHNPWSLSFWQQASQVIHPLEISQAVAYVYFPLSKAYQCLAQWFETQNLDEVKLGQQCEAMVETRGWLPSFSSFTQAFQTKQPEIEPRKQAKIDP